MTREEMREKFWESFEVTAKRIEKRQAKIAACQDEIARYDTIFLYGAGTDGIMVADFLRDTLKGKSVSFIDKNTAKHGMEIVPGIFCHGLEKMYGWGEKAIVVITTFAYADGIFYELTRPQNQMPDKLEGTRITDDLARLLFYDANGKRRMEARDNLMNLFDWMGDDYSCEILYKASQGNIPFIDFNPEKIVPPMEDFLPPEIQRRLAPEGVFLCGGTFVGEIMEELYKAANGQYKAWYTFEVNRIYCDQLKEKFHGENILLVNAGLGAKDARVDMSLRGNGITPYRYLDICSDDFVNIRSVDAMVADGTLTEKITFVRLFMEGAEMPALEGMKETLKHDRPIVAVSVFGHYKTPQESMDSLAAFLKATVPDYKLMIRNHLYLGEGGTVLYAFVDG